jgi:hypothetical protein
MDVATRDRAWLPAPPRPRSGGSPRANGFVYGRPAGWLATAGQRLVSCFEWTRDPDTEERPPVLITFSKLLGWIVIGIAGAAGCGLALSFLMLRMYTAAFG